LRRTLAFYDTEKKGAEQIIIVPPYCPCVYGRMDISPRVS